MKEAYLVGGSLRDFFIGSITIKIFHPASVEEMKPSFIHTKQMTGQLAIEISIDGNKVILKGQLFERKELTLTHPWKNSREYSARFKEWI